jgi:hypothetical protein
MFKQLAITDPSDLRFGVAPKPLTTRHGLTIGGRRGEDTRTRSLMVGHHRGPGIRIAGKRGRVHQPDDGRRRPVEVCSSGLRSDMMLQVISQMISSLDQTEVVA